MYAGSTEYYDLFYRAKDYAGEAERTIGLIRERHPAARTLLDAACGTGSHLAHFKEAFRAEGLDISPGFVRLAARKNPGIPVHRGNLVHFRLPSTYDAIVCLFSSIGYVETERNLRRAIACMARHLTPGGLLLVEPWFPPEAWQPGTTHALLVEEPGLKLARLSTSLLRKGRSYFELHYLVATAEGTRHLVERHSMGLFTRAQMEGAFAAAGLRVEYLEEGISGRGLYIGRS
jgi:SAM-dependent methyltransferase